MATTKPAEFWHLLEGDDRAKSIANLWTTHNNNRRTWIEEKKELRNYIFATDTSTTSNSTLPWKNKTTLPKLCQIRDNLHSNYISALFPNDDWLKWEAYSEDSALKKKKTSIIGYMSNKTRISNFRSVISRLLYDYIDTGNAFVMPAYVNKRIEKDGEEFTEYEGPVAKRISPFDIVFDPLAPSFEDTWKIVRELKTIGELKLQADQEPDNKLLQDALLRRELFTRNLLSFGIEDDDKAAGYVADGFGSLQQYYTSGYVELLYFYGDFHDNQTGTLQKKKVFIVMDRAHIIAEGDIPGWLGNVPIYHVGWRYRPDNLWAMGPLDNLVGIQYRIDHLENLKADAMDLLVHPPLVIQGEVEEFDYGPGAEIHIDENGAVSELAKNTQYVIMAENEIAMLEQKMEEFAGAPKEAMGIRTPGEKTAFEVDKLFNAAGRIFQEKITQFETELLEKLLNSMLEVSRRNLNIKDSVRVMDDDLGVETFLEITRDDITASGKLRPIGARHFAAQNQLMLNLTQLYNSPLAQLLAPHTSSKAMYKLVEDILGLERYSLFRDNVAITEQQETSRQAAQAQEDLMVEQQTETLV